MARAGCARPWHDRAGPGGRITSMKITLRQVHRYLALALAVLWLSQALTGLVMVFRWELDDAFIAGDAVPLDPAALEQIRNALAGAP